MKLSTRIWMLLPWKLSTKVWLRLHSPRTWMWMKRIFALVCITLLIFAGIYVSANTFNISSRFLVGILRDPVSAGVLVAVVGLLGAVVGGLLGFSGSVYAQKQQAAANAMIAARNNIYIPLYDELRRTRYVLSKDLFPHFPQFNNIFVNGMYNDPIFSTWEGIKIDHRERQVPDMLAHELEKYSSMIKEYYTMRLKLLPDLDKKIRVVVFREYINVRALKNADNIGIFLGSEVFSRIFRQEDNRHSMIDKLMQDIYPSVVHARALQEYRGHKIESYDAKRYRELGNVVDIVCDECAQIQPVLQFRSTTHELVELLDELLQTLDVIIEFISEKYESRQRIF